MPQQWVPVYGDTNNDYDPLLEQASDEKVFAINANIIQIRAATIRVAKVLNAPLKDYLLNGDNVQGIKTSSSPDDTLNSVRDYVSVPCGNKNVQTSCSSWIYSYFSEVGNRQFSPTSIREDLDNVRTIPPEADTIASMYENDNNEDFEINDAAEQSDLTASNEASSESQEEVGCAIENNPHEDSDLACNIPEVLMQRVELPEVSHGNTGHALKLRAYMVLMILGCSAIILMIIKSHFSNTVFLISFITFIAIGCLSVALFIFLHRKWGPVYRDMNKENDPLLERTLDGVCATNESFVAIKTTAVEISQVLNASPGFPLIREHISSSSSSVNTLQTGSDYESMSEVSGNRPYSGSSLIYTYATIVGNGSPASIRRNEDELHVILPKVARILPIEGDMNSSSEDSDSSELSNFVANIEEPSQNQEVNGSADANNPSQDPCHDSTHAADVAEVETQREERAEGRNLRHGLFLEIGCYLGLLVAGCFAIAALVLKDDLSNTLMQIGCIMFVIVVFLLLMKFSCPLPRFYDFSSHLISFHPSFTSILSQVYRQWVPATGDMNSEVEPLLGQEINEVIPAAISAQILRAAVRFEHIVNAPQSGNFINGNHFQGVEKCSSYSSSSQQGRDNAFMPGKWWNTQSFDNFCTSSFASAAESGESSCTPVTKDAAEVDVIPPAAAPLLPIKEDNVEGDISQGLEISYGSEISDFNASNELSEKHDFGDSRGGNNPPQEPDPAGSISQVEQVVRETYRLGSNRVSGFLVKLGSYLAILAVGWLIVAMLSYQGYFTSTVLIISFVMLILKAFLSVITFIYGCMADDRSDLECTAEAPAAIPNLAEIDIPVIIEL